MDIECAFVLFEIIAMFMGFLLGRMTCPKKE